MMPKHVNAQPTAATMLKMPLMSWGMAIMSGGQLAGTADALGDGPVGDGPVGGTVRGASPAGATSGIGSAPKADANSGKSAASRQGPVADWPTGVVEMTRRSATQRWMVARSTGPKVCPLPPMIQ